MHSTRSSPNVLITFWGAAQSVTGSQHLVEAFGQRLLLDCGLVRGMTDSAHLGSSPFPFWPREVDAVVLSHAHIDHCGNLPSLVRQGFSGPIYCTAATRDLLALMLANMARIQEEDAFVHRVIGRPETVPYCTQDDVDQTVQQCVALPYDQPREIGPGIAVRLVDAGHILGSAMVALTFAREGRLHRLTFTGDLGRRGAPLLRDPAPVPAADLIISESTYGGRTLEPVASTVAAFQEVVRRTIERNGKVLIPAFSLGRTQMVVHVLQQGMSAGALPRVPILVDSPLAAAITAVYQQYGAGGPESALRRLPDATQFLDGPTVRFVRSWEESKELSLGREPCVIIAPGGMCEGGRIVHHLKHYIDDPRCSVVLVNYQAPHTLGRRLLERGPTVRFHGRVWNKWADIVYLAGFSGHADREDLLALLGPAVGLNPKIRLVHGELEQAKALAEALRQQGITDVGIPARGEAVSLF